jgi:hypothetical protein
MLHILVYGIFNHRIIRYGVVTQRKASMFDTGCEEDNARAKLLRRVIRNKQRCKQPRICAPRHKKYLHCLISQSLVQQDCARERILLHGCNRVQSWRTVFDNRQKSIYEAIVPTSRLKIALVSFNNAWSSCSKPSKGIVCVYIYQCCHLPRQHTRREYYTYMICSQLT